jgi:hypothetical protein
MKALALWPSGVLPTIEALRLATSGGLDSGDSEVGIQELSLFANHY